ncbi:MAG: hypothetical protein PHW18_04990 [Sulfuricurvum sp.]|uniref:hypothetical protein n=1 Tax=Sulfuricurvum sp. TaxID=2025608 RepID=UPI00262EAC32|nr:hypothetical protein [Sulfuricurvum sp.]MDD2828910.1 hypothetical protein [Sulfuricurvum sp.]MDD4948573.1 hypothetical protein [Sulfuricurvum sp.]
MIRFVLLCYFLSLNLHADTSSQMFQLYQKGDYAASCNIGFQHLKQLEFNEAYTSLYAFSCLKADQIDRLNDPIMILNQTREARANASFFSLIVLQKKLLTQALFDNYPIKTLKLPTSSHLLSKLFNFYQNNPQPQSTVKEYIDSINPRISYKLYSIEITGRKTIAIDEYYDKILTLHHVY